MSEPAADSPRDRPREVGVGADRLAPLDALRGLAAIGVACGVHYQHFGGDKATYPFGQVSAFRWMYDTSWVLVDLFFLLSGVVMTYRYLEPIAQRKVDGREFFFLRMSRLYPLHFVALLVSAAVQWTLMARNEPTAIYKANDVYNFSLQLVYLGAFFEHDTSFNEPSWSVSAELLAYALFFFFARRYRANYFVLAVIATVAGICMQQPAWTLPFLNTSSGRAVLGFFLGSSGYLLIRALDRRGWGERFGWACLGAFVILCVVSSFIGYHKVVGGVPLPNALSVFPLIVFASLRVPPLARLLSLRVFKLLGDISYSVYMIHVPIQQLTLAVSRAYKLTLPTESPWMLLCWVVVIVLAATATHYGFELPARRWLRAHRPSAATPVAAAS
jgi:peptidoglycan/LPS O-acetylase OafA/YrhL